jgi:SMI1-KNR4 cell-wall
MIDNNETMKNPLNMRYEDFLKVIEQFWSFKLPKDYRNFLLNYDGNVPKRNIFSMKDASNASVVHNFFYLVPDRHLNLLINSVAYSDRVPSNMLVIGDDPCGNKILLSVKMADRGKVYFWDHEREAGEGEKPDYSNLTLIADSFEEFINNLKSEEEVNLIDS